MANNFVLSAIIQVLDKATEPLQKIGRSFGNLGVMMSETLARMAAVSDRMKHLGKNLEGIGGSLMKGITIPVLGLGAAALKTYGDFELMTANMATMFGGDEKAAKGFIDQLEELEKTSHYETEELAKNAQTLMTYGVSYDKIIPLLRRFGDIAGGNQEKMNGLAESFSHVSAAGTMSTRDLRLMINSGFNPLMAISKATGMSMERLRKVMEDGGIPLVAVSKAFQVATEKGGGYYKGMERGAKTLPVMFGLLKKEGGDALRALGESLKVTLKLSEKLPELAKRIRAVAESVKKWSQEHPKLTAFIVKFLLALAAIGPLFYGLGKALTTLAGIAKLFSMIKDYGGFSGTLRGLVKMGAVLGTILVAAMAIQRIYELWQAGKKEVIEAKFAEEKKKREDDLELARISAEGKPKGSKEVKNYEQMKQQEDFYKNLYKVPSIPGSKDEGIFPSPERIKMSAEKGERQSLNINLRLKADEGTSAVIEDYKASENLIPKITVDNLAENYG